MAGSCLIITLGVKFRFRIFDCYSPPRTLLGAGDVVVSTKDSVEAVEDAAHRVTNKRVSSKTNFDLEVWEVGWFQSQNPVWQGFDHFAALGIT